VLLPWLSFLDARVKEPSESVERSPETVEGSKDATLCWDPRELTELLMPRRPESGPSTRLRQSAPGDRGALDGGDRVWGADKGAWGSESDEWEDRVESGPESGACGDVSMVASPICLAISVADRECADEIESPRSIMCPPCSSSDPLELRCSCQDRAKVPCCIAAIRCWMSSREGCGLSLIVSPGGKFSKRYPQQRADLRRAERWHKDSNVLNPRKARAQAHFLTSRAAREQGTRAAKRQRAGLL